MADITHRRSTHTLRSSAIISENEIRYISSGPSYDAMGVTTLSPDATPSALCAGPLRRCIWGAFVQLTNAPLAGPY